MATEKRLIDANELEEKFRITKIIEVFPEWENLSFQTKHKLVQYGKTVKMFVQNIPTVEAVEVEKYKELVEMYHELRENFIDYVCSGTCNVAPYCLNRCEGCVDRVGWCAQGSDECHGFNPAEVILDGDGNG